LSVVPEIVPELVPPLRVKTTVSPPAVNWFPYASLAVNVRVINEPEATEPLETLTTDCDSEYAPGVTVTVGSVELTGVPFIVEVIVVAVPETVPVNVAVYVPLLLSVTAENVPEAVPPVLENAIDNPPDVRLFPAASFEVSVTVTLEPAPTVPPETLTIDCDTLGPPGVTVIDGKADVTAEPPIVDAIVVAVPDVVPVNVPVYVPLLLSVTAENVPFETPPLRENRTVRPPPVKLLPNESLAVSVSVDVEPD
jgi:hypothetical protein